MEWGSHLSSHLVDSPFSIRRQKWGRSGKAVRKGVEGKEKRSRGGGVQCSGSKLNVSRLTWSTATCTRDRSGARVIGDHGDSTQASRPIFVATQSGLGYAERRTWPKGHPPAMT